jgi:pimeloyl-ACP methyl ester carboxylesterase
MELQWKMPGFGDFLDELGSLGRLIRFDKRGTGMSDPVSGAPSLETPMDDVRAVMDAAGSRRAAFYGLSEGAAMSNLSARNGRRRRSRASRDRDRRSESGQGDQEGDPHLTMIVRV